MLLHLPIVIITTLLPVAISDTPPRFDIAKECRFESESSKAFDRCARDESDALKQLETEPERRMTLGGRAGQILWKRRQVL